MEAHAQDEWPINTKLQLNQHKNLEERKSAAAKFIQQNSFKLPLYLDTMENSFHSIFGAWPERYYILHQGKMAQLGNPGLLDTIQLHGQMRSQSG